MPTVYVDVDIDLTDFDTEDLIEELESRGGMPVDNGGAKQVVETIYQKRRLGQDYDSEVDQLIYQVLGRVI
jgi:hypothetical protein